MSEIYKPDEDTYFLSDTLKKYVEKKKIKSLLEIGCGSGFNLETAKKLKIKNILGADINGQAIKHCKKLGFNCLKSNLFSNIKDKFDLIIFNPPYLPEDTKEPNDSKIATTGGKEGSEIINRFHEQAPKFLNRQGRILLLASSLTKGIDFKKFAHKIIAKKKLFFEELYIYESWMKEEDT